MLSRVRRWTLYSRLPVMVCGKLNQFILFVDASQTKLAEIAELQAMGRIKSDAVKLQDGINQRVSALP